MAVLAAAMSFLKSLGSVLIILGCFSGRERILVKDKFPHSSSAPPKHDCHWLIFTSLKMCENLAFSTKLCSQEG